MFIDLERQKLIQRWRAITERWLDENRDCDLSDAELFNAVAKRHHRHMREWISGPVD